MTTAHSIIEAGVEKLGADCLAFTWTECGVQHVKARTGNNEYIHPDERPAWHDGDSLFVLPDDWESTTTFHPSFRHKSGAYVERMNGSWSYNIPGQKKLYVKRIRPTAPECFRVVQEWIEELTLGKESE